jgi:hypothetical protein
VQREPIGLGHPLQSRIRPVQRADGADHERFASLLWANGDAVGDGTAQDLGHGVGVFGGSRSSQALSVSCSSKPWRSRQRPTRWLISSTNFLQLAFVWRLDALKSGWAVVAIYVDAIQEQDVKVYIEVEGRSEALDQRYRPGSANP